MSNNTVFGVPMNVPDARDAHGARIIPYTRETLPVQLRGVFPFDPDYDPRTYRPQNAGPSYHYQFCRPLPHLRCLCNER